VKASLLKVETQVSKLRQEIGDQESIEAEAVHASA